MTEREAIDMLHNNLTAVKSIVPFKYFKNLDHTIMHDYEIAVEVLKTAVVELEIYRMNDKHLQHEKNDQAAPGGSTGTGQIPGA